MKMQWGSTGQQAGRAAIYLPHIIGIGVALAGNASAAERAVPQDGATQSAALEEIVVTSRRREESVQDVPDSITVLSAAMLEAAGVKEVGDFVQMTPNITLREAYRAGVTLITIRGITTGQQGWAPVTYVVDGVPTGSLDAINLGALVGVERIEVLKGPQSALYGAGAIAGAINVITKDPTDEFESEGRVSLGKGRDVQTALSVSGPVVADSVLFRLDGYYRKGDGLLEDQDGDHLDFERQGEHPRQVAVQLVRREARCTRALHGYPCRRRVSGISAAERRGGWAAG